MTNQSNDDNKNLRDLYDSREVQSNDPIVESSQTLTLYKDEREYNEVLGIVKDLLGSDADSDAIGEVYEEKVDRSIRIDIQATLGEMYKQDTGGAVGDELLSG